MQTRQLGHSDIQVVPLAFGGNVFGWTVDEARSFELLDAFVDRGFNFIDTADVYSVWVPGNKGGESETILGKWFKRSGKRDKIVLATKVGHSGMPGSQRLQKAYILEEVEHSLTRLQTDVIDLYQSHQDDPETPIDETLEAYDKLIQQGKVRIIGASNFSAARTVDSIQIAEKKALPVYQTLQPEYNLYDRKAYETELAPTAAEYGLSVLPYFSLASGFLTGKYKSKDDSKGAMREGRVAKYFDDRGMKILAALETVAEETDAQQASVALAWLLAQPTVTAPLASATKLEQLEALFAAVDLKLTEAQVKTLTKASAY